MTIKTFLATTALLLFSLFAFSCKDDDNQDHTDTTKKVVYLDPVAVVKSNATQVFAHYMPWFETPQTTANGKWGQHWTMASRNPDVQDANGKRQIASWFYPTIGPYASSDPALIEYHLLLMKYSGIDGVLIDWYGSQNIYDYQANTKNAEALIALIGKVGLKYAIVYEDRTIKAAIDNNLITDAIETAKQDMAYAESNYFNTKEYITIGGKPLMLVFGPEYFHKPAEWQDILADVSTKPCFITLNGHSNETAPASSGEYVWVDANTLDAKYKTQNNFSVYLGGAYPGFKDYYKAGGWGDGYPLPYPHNEGNLFKENLQQAKDAKAKYLQLITWNDFGEGTMIEPTDEFGYSLLESVQQFTGVAYTKADLEPFFTLFNLRKNVAADKDVQLSLDQAFNYFVALQNEKATAILDSIKTTLSHKKITE